MTHRTYRHPGLSGLPAVLRARRKAHLPPPHWQHEVAACCDYTPKHFSRFTTGERACPETLFNRLCGLLACRDADLQPTPEGGPTPGTATRGPLPCPDGAAGVGGQGAEV